MGGREGSGGKGEGNTALGEGRQEKKLHWQKGSQWRDKRGYNSTLRVKAVFTKKMRKNKHGREDKV